MKKYINSKTYELDKDIFEVDELMTDSIILLNKKGYKTENCCQGHYSQQIHKMKCNNDNIDEIIKINNLKEYDVIEKDGEYILYFSDIDTRIYINFKSAYLFNNLPKGFNKTKKWDENSKKWVIDTSTNVSGIEKYINFYNNNQKKNIDEIKKEIEQSNKDIYGWVKELPKTEEKEG